MLRKHIIVNGQVQGVGFRPFVFRLAHEIGLTGEVSNSAAGVVIEVEGDTEKVDTFFAQFHIQLPAHARVTSMDVTDIDLKHDEGFTIIESDKDGAPQTLVMPDLATCQDCLNEMRNPLDRRYQYPFINCINCGPRYSIVSRLPYDRVDTSSTLFRMCHHCTREYKNPIDRRFHAQPIACPKCGPQIFAKTPDGNLVAGGNDALALVKHYLEANMTVAFKSIGGFQLMCLANAEDAVHHMRSRKNRMGKPLAIMCKDMEMAHRYAHICPRETELLTSAAAPIVLLRPKKDSDLASNISPACPHIGIMLPYTPLHHMLMGRINQPLVATSGNRSGQPLSFTNGGAMFDLHKIADLFLLHDRPILNPIDDSVVMLAANETVVLRRARGYVPLPLPGPEADGFAAGADLKNTFALNRKGQMFLSPHHGDMASDRAEAQYLRDIVRFGRLFGGGDGLRLRDQHPDYHTTALLPKAQGVQHHMAHLHACMGEHQLEPPVLGAIWDGTGYGGDGTIWGGELLLAGPKHTQRMGHMYPFPLPGGERAILEPKRTAVGMLYATYGDDWEEKCPDHLKQAFEERVWKMLPQILERGLNCPLSSAVGRLYDGFAALMGLCYHNDHEAAAPMALEAEALTQTEHTALPYALTSEDDIWIWDWRPTLEAVIAAKDPKTLAAQLHWTFANMLVDAADQLGVETVALAGGCFQNRLLLEAAVTLLHDRGKQPYFCAQIPPGDGGIAAGQIFYAARYQTQ